METLTMSAKEVPRAGLLKAVLAGRITNAQGATALRMSVRQFQEVRHRPTFTVADVVGLDPTQAVRDRERCALRTDESRGPDQTPELQSNSGAPTMVSAPESRIRTLTVEPDATMSLVRSAWTPLIGSPRLSSLRDFQIFTRPDSDAAAAWHPPCTSSVAEGRPLPDKGKPVARRGRKATGQAEGLTAGLPKEGDAASPGHGGLPRRGTICFREPGGRFGRRARCSWPHRSPHLPWPNHSRASP